MSRIRTTGSCVFLLSAIAIVNATISSARSLKNSSSPISCHMFSAIDLPTPFASKRSSAAFFAEFTQVIRLAGAAKPSCRTRFVSK